MGAERAEPERDGSTDDVARLPEDDVALEDGEPVDVGDLDVDVHRAELLRVHDQRRVFRIAAGPEHRGWEIQARVRIGLSLRHRRPPLPTGAGPGEPADDRHRGDGTSTTPTRVDHRHCHHRGSVSKRGIRASPQRHPYSAP
jgi:hypothetical protein